MRDVAALVLGIAVGVATYASPAVLGLDGAPRTSQLVAGPIAASIAAAALEPAVRGAARLLLLPALWLVLAPVFIVHPPAIAAESIGLGVVLAGIAFLPRRLGDRFGGGWLALVSAPPAAAPGPRASIPPHEEVPMSRVVVITGASAGAGRAAARAFADDGWDVALLARGEAGLDAAADDVRRAGSRALPIPLDVADAAAVEAAAERVERELGPIDVWVNDAMESVFAPVTETTPDEYRRVTEVNYLGYVHGTLAALRRMKARDAGVIVQIGSALAYRSIPLQSAYCASKHAIVGFTDSLRCELIHDRSNVRLTAVHLPALNTPQFGWVRSRLPERAQPVPPIFEPEVAARAILHAAKHPRRELYVGAPTLLAVWGQKFAPNLLDWYLGRTGYRAQQTGEPRPERPDNLDAPVDATEDHGAHGRFDRPARERSLALELSLHRGLVATAAAGALGALVGLRLLAGGRGRDGA